MTEDILYNNFGLNGHDEWDNLFDLEEYEEWDEIFGLGKKGKAKREVRRARRKKKKELRMTKKELKVEKRRLKGEERKAGIEATRSETGLMAQLAGQPTSMDIAPTGNGAVQTAGFGGKGTMQTVLVLGLVAAGIGAYVMTKNKQAAVAPTMAA